MSLLIQCPLPASIGDLSKLACAVNFGQIVRVGFQRVGYAFTDITDEAEWDALLAAPSVGPPVTTDQDKVQITTFCENVIIPQSEAITEGGDDNTTLFGQALVVGKGQITVTGRFRGLDSDGKRELDPYLSEASVYNQIGVYLINEFGQVIASNPTGPSTAGATVFPIQSFFISDVGSEGFNTNNFNNFQWNFISGWADNFYVYDPGFDILSK